MAKAKQNGLPSYEEFHTRLEAFSEKVTSNPDGYFSLFFCKISEALMKFERERQKEHKN